MVVNDAMNDDIIVYLVCSKAHGGALHVTGP